jgi:hypothetical protein
MAGRTPPLPVDELAESTGNFRSVVRLCGTSVRACALIK